MTRREIQEVIKKQRGWSRAGIQPTPLSAHDTQRLLVGHTLVMSCKIPKSLHQLRSFICCGRSLPVAFYIKTKLLAGRHAAILRVGRKYSTLLEY
jgi:hypothetical protein